MFTITTEFINAEKLTKSYSTDGCGARVTFEGIVRRDKHLNHEVTSLLYIANEPECVTQGEQIIREAQEKFALSCAVCVQRIGTVAVEETAIWIGVWSPHRDAAFLGCRYIIEEIKKRLLIWKKEFFVDGSSQWVRGQTSTITI